MKRASKSQQEAKTALYRKLKPKPIPTQRGGPEKAPKVTEMRLTLHGKDDLQSLFELINKFDHEYPLEVVVSKAKKNRSLAQNRTQWQWFRDAQAQGDQKAWEWRAYCKLHFGVPILRRDSLDYREKYDSILKPLEYEKKLALMVEPFDFPVTSGMTVIQHGEYLDRVREHFESLGFELTDPSSWDVRYF